MNGEEKQDLKVVVQMLKQAKEDRADMASDIHNIKENLFDPHKGLWAETTKNTDHRKSSKETLDNMTSKVDNIDTAVTKNTDFREGTTKWRTVVGAGVFGLALKQIWEYFSSLGQHH